MLKFFFNRDSVAMKAAGIIGLLLSVAASILKLHEGAGAATWILFALFWAAFLFILACGTMRWYEDAPRGSGMELHLRKALVPTSYIMLVSGAALFFINPIIVLSIDLFLFILIAHVNVILICLHRRDPDATPPNFYTSRRFMRNS